MIKGFRQPAGLLALTLLLAACQRGATSESKRGETEPGAGETTPAPPSPAPPPDDTFVEGRPPVPTSGVNLTYFNARPRCDYVEIAPKRYRIDCEAVAVQSDGRELRATAIADDLLVTWRDPRRLAGSLANLSCAPTSTLLEFSCDATLDNAVEAALLGFDLALQKKETTESRTESVVVRLPYSVGVVAGFVPQIPFDYVQSDGEAPPASGEAPRGFQARAFDPDVGVFDKVRDVCVRGESLFFATLGFVYRLEKGAVSLYAGASPFRAGDRSHRLRLKLGTDLGLACGKDFVAVSDVDGHVVYRLDDAGTVSILAGNGAGESAPDGAVAASSPVKEPNRMAFDADGLLVFAEGLAVRRIDAAGKLTTIARVEPPATPLVGTSASSREAIGGLALGPDGSLMPLVAPPPPRPPPPAAERP